MTMLDVRDPAHTIELGTAPPHTTRVRPRWALELGLVALLYLAYDTTRGLGQGTLASANNNGARFLQWERALHLDPETTLNHLLWHIPALAVASSYYYATLHFIVTPAALIWLYRSHPTSYRSARTALALATGASLIIFWLLPTTPPRLLPEAGIHDILAHVHQWGWWGGDGSAPRGFGSLTNQLAAMPSLHVGWALWSGWLIATHARRRTIRALGAAYPVLTAVVVMGTGNHYFLDTLGGAAIIAMSAGVVSLAAHRHASSRPRGGPFLSRAGSHPRLAKRGAVESSPGNT